MPYVPRVYTVWHHTQVLTCVAVKSGAPKEQASGRRWIEPDGCTMVSESSFRKDRSQPWAMLRRTWTLDHMDPRPHKVAVER